MVKRFFVFISLLAILFFFVGCEPESAEKPQVEPSKPVLTEPQPAKPESPETGLPASKLPESELPKPESTKVAVPKSEAEPPEIEPSKPKPSRPKPTPKVTFHDKCAPILTHYVNNEGMVNYKELRRKKVELNRLLDDFAELEPSEYKSWPKEDKIAFWISAYNIKMLKVIVDNYPIESTRILRIIWGPDSIRHIDRNIGGIWRSKFVVMDEEFTLAEIQRRLFRKEFDEPRILFALNIGCLSGPPLRNEPYFGSKLYKQLDNQVKKFLSGSKAFKIDKENKIVYLSALLKPTWHGKEFVSKFGTDKKFKDQQPETRAVLNFLTDYVSSRDESFLEVEYYTVEYMRFDWTINDG